MVKIFKASPQARATGQEVELTIERLDVNGLGVAKLKGKPIFVAGTLPNERVKARVVEHKSKYAKAKLTSVVHASPDRVEPQCTHFSHCGGCDLQHLSSIQQREFKQKKIAELFSREQIGDLPWQPAVFEQSWQYRRKARIGVQYNKHGKPTVGFRKKLTNELAPIKSCPVLEQKLDNIFEQLNLVLADLTQHKPIGHIEVFATEPITIVVRQLQALSNKDKEHWIRAAEENQWQVFFDTGEEIVPLLEEQPKALSYKLDDKLVIQFRPSDFIQVNAKVNQCMVAQAVEWLALSKEDKVLDLFCGLGNFSLALALKSRHVVAVEGVAAMTQQAKHNADINNVDNCQFFHADLNNNWQQQTWAQQTFDKVLLDPARAGAYEACQQLIKFKPKSILYVSCDPTTLARDSKLLNDAGYQIDKIALIDMFSQTKHVETMVLFRQN